MPMVANTNVITLYSTGKFISSFHFCYPMNILLQPNANDEQGRIDGVKIQIKKTLRSIVTDPKLPRF
jgi:hypothetical protein